jgi:hypothetical protein
MLFNARIILSNDCMAIMMACWCQWYRMPVISAAFDLLSHRCVGRGVAWHRGKAREGSGEGGVPECCAAEEGWGGVQVSQSRSKEWKVPRDDEIFFGFHQLLCTQSCCCCHVIYALRAVPPVAKKITNKRTNLL